MTALPGSDARESGWEAGPTGSSLVDAPCTYVTRLAAAILDVPIALLSLPRAEEYRFRVNIGLDGFESVPSRISFCAYTLLSTDVLVVTDARFDPRFHQNPLVLGDPHIVTYVGAPLVSSRGVKLGTLCAIDHQPRTFSSSQLDQLRDVARVAASLLEAETQMHAGLIAERERLAIALHEGVAQDLFALRLQLQQLRNSSLWQPAGDIDAAAAVADFSRALDCSINDICDLADGLKPGVADSMR